MTCEATEAVGLDWDGHNPLSSLNGTLSSN